MERLEYDLLLRWFVGIGVDDAAWDHSVFSKNRDRLLEGNIAAKFLSAVLAAQGEEAPFHGSLLGRRNADRGLGAMKSLKPKDSSGYASGEDRRRAYPAAMST